MSLHVSCRGAPSSLDVYCWTDRGRNGAGRGLATLVVVSTTAILTAMSAATATGAADTTLLPTSTKVANIKLSPHQGPVGTTVHFHGHVTRSHAGLFEGFINQFLTGTMKRHNGHDCSAEVALRKAHCHFNRRTDELRGHFTIGHQERCAPTVTKHERSQRTQSGTYTFSVGCVGCAVGTFTITSRSASSVND
jgi:hypothetical protein